MKNNYVYLEDCTFTFEDDTYMWQKLFPDLLDYNDMASTYETRTDIDITLDMIEPNIDVDFFMDWYDPVSSRDLILFLVNEAAMADSFCPLYMNAYENGEYVQAGLLI